MRIIFYLLLVLYSLTCLVGMGVETLRRGSAGFARSYRITIVPFVIVGVVFGMVGILGEELMEAINAGERWFATIDQRIRIQPPSPPADRKDD